MQEVYVSAVNSVMTDSNVELPAGYSGMIGTNITKSHTGRLPKLDNCLTWTTFVFIYIQDF